MSEHIGYGGANMSVLDGSTVQSKVVDDAVTR